jgi:hypothetical protein
MEPIVRTIYGAHLQTSLLTQKPFFYHPNSTLNEKFQIEKDYVVPVGQYPSLNYIAIGNKGVRLTLGADGMVLTEPLQHLPRHASLYNHIPFIMRPVDDDLTAIERAMYRMRVIERIDGVDYACYYLKVLDKSMSDLRLELRSVDNGNITSIPFTPSQSDLFPEQPPISSQQLITTNGDYLVSTSKVPFILDQNEVNEILDVCRNKYGDERYAVISEVALCTGIDNQSNAVISGTNVTYTESVATQIAAHFSVFNPLNTTTTGIDLEFDVGSVEPLLF